MRLQKGQKPARWPEFYAVVRMWPSGFYRASEYNLMKQTDPGNDEVVDAGPLLYQVAIDMARKLNEIAGVHES